MKDKVLPGEHSHSDRPNWQPAETMNEYMSNCREGLEKYSEKRAAELLGWSRTHMWRVMMTTHIPPDLFELLLAGLRASGKLCSAKELAQIGRAFHDGTLTTEQECCPNCGYVLRVRGPWGKSCDQIIRAWLKDRKP